MAEQTDVDRQANGADIRKSWTVGSKVQIFSDSSQKWLRGEIFSIRRDQGAISFCNLQTTLNLNLTDGEWLYVQYGEWINIHKFGKEVKRDSDDIHPIKRNGTAGTGQCWQCMHFVSYENDLLI